MSMLSMGLAVNCMQYPTAANGWMVQSMHPIACTQLGYVTAAVLPNRGCCACSVNMKLPSQRTQKMMVRFMLPQG